MAMRLLLSVSKLYLPQQGAMRFYSEQTVRLNAIFRRTQRSKMKTEKSPQLQKNEKIPTAEQIMSDKSLLNQLKEYYKDLNKYKS